MEAFDQGKRNFSQIARDVGVYDHRVRRIAIVVGIESSRTKRTPEEIRQRQSDYNRAYYAKNREKIRAYYKEWLKKRKQL